MSCSLLHRGSHLSGWFAIHAGLNFAIAKPQDGEAIDDSNSYMVAAYKRCGVRYDFLHY
jgi:hypothetical protein